MIKKFYSQEEFNNWLGDNVLPSKIVAYIIETEVYVFHSNNAGGDEVVSATFDELLESYDVPFDTLMEIMRFEENLHPLPPSGDLETRVTTLETKMDEVNPRLSTVETGVNTLETKVDEDVDPRLAVVEAEVEDIQDQIGVIDTTLANILGDE